MQVRVRVLREGPKGERLLSRAYLWDACHDLQFRPIDGCERIIRDRERAVLETGISLDMSNGWEAVVRPRSGMTTDGVDVSIGTIDAGYRGEVFVCLSYTRMSEDFRETFIVKPGMRIAQIAFRTIPAVELVEVENLSASERGSRGRGSSGV